MRVKLRFVVGVAAIWLAAVAGVSVTAWLAIDRAGREVTSAGVSALPKVLISKATATTTPGQGPSSTDPTTKPPASKTPTPSASNPSTVSSSPSPPSNGQTDAVSSTPVRDRTVTVVGGQVSVRCIGAALTLRIAQPDNGWRVELDRSDAGDVPVTFKNGDSEASGETHVTAVCTAGTPVFTVDSKH